ARQRFLPIAGSGACCAPSTPAPATAATGRPFGNGRRIAIATRPPRSAPSSPPPRTPPPAGQYPADDAGPGTRCRSRPPARPSRSAPRGPARNAPPAAGLAPPAAPISARQRPQTLQHHSPLSSPPALTGQRASCPRVPSVGDADYPGITNARNQPPGGGIGRPATTQVVWYAVRPTGHRPVGVGGPGRRQQAGGRGHRRQCVTGCLA